MSLKKSLIYVILLLLTALVFSGCGSKAAPAQEVSAAESGEKSAQAEAQGAKSSEPSSEAPQATSSEAKPQEDPSSRPSASEPAGKDSAPSAEDPGKAAQPSQPENKPADAPAQTAPAAPSDDTKPAQKTEPAAPSEPASPSEQPANTDAKPEAPAEGNGGKKKKDSYSGFFEDSLFIGDSRSVGLVEYGNVGEPTAFCHTGLSVYNYDNDDLDVAGFGKISLADLLELGSFDRVYVGLGINELGYAEDTTVQKFGELIDLIKANQPSANIYVLANLHVTAARSRKDKTHNNGKIDSLNSRLESLCDGTKVIYIDGNPLFDDGNGALSEDFTGDNTHLYARCYPTWSQLIYESSKQ
ncbi:MAG: hypothetical protein IJK25_06420 [Firmicutes bacterium]|nr:hypothetical protein [Bacillota bacterium]